MKFTNLSYDQRAALEINGFLVVGDALDDVYRRQMIEVGDRLVARGTRKNMVSDFGPDGIPVSHDGDRTIIDLDPVFVPLLILPTTQNRETQIKMTTLNQDST
ncbi:MAG: hypothetical protein O3C57_06380 [Verrucomicrobia bacterium]|nr:hypothetical protein [Verrucomicrobiota bacterium]